jgi:hypothetical protein
MIIYVAHASRFDFKKELYQPLWDSTISKEYNLIFPHDEVNSQFPSKKLFESRNCDLLLAEASYPSTGLGIEMGWANCYNIPILCIHKVGMEPSPAVKAIVRKIVPYHDLADSVDSLEKDIKLLIPDKKPTKEIDIF